MTKSITISLHIAQTTRILAYNPFCLVTLKENRIIMPVSLKTHKRYTQISGYNSSLTPKFLSVLTCILWRVWATHYSALLPVFVWPVLLLAPKHQHSWKSDKPTIYLQQRPKSRPPSTSGIAFVAAMPCRSSTTVASRLR